MTNLEIMYKLKEMYNKVDIELLDESIKNHFSSKRANQLRELQIELHNAIKELDLKIARL